MQLNHTLHNSLKLKAVTLIEKNLIEYNKIPKWKSNVVNTASYNTIIIKCWQ